jgi:hypothetical protein
MSRAAWTRVDDADDLDAIIYRTVENQILIEMLDPPGAYVGQAGVG